MLKGTSGPTSLPKQNHLEQEDRDSFPDIFQNYIQEIRGQRLDKEEQK